MRTRASKDLVESHPADKRQIWLQTPFPMLARDNASSFHHQSPGIWMVKSCPFPFSRFSNQFPFFLSFLALWLFGPKPNTCQVTVEAGGFEGSQQRGLDFAGKTWSPPAVNTRSVFTPKRSGLGSRCPWLMDTLLCIFMGMLSSLTLCEYQDMRRLGLQWPNGTIHSVWGSWLVTWQGWELWESLGECLTARVWFGSQMWFAVFFRKRLSEIKAFL